MGGYGTSGYGLGGYGGGTRPPGQVPSFDYYLSLLTSEYQNSPNLKAWLQALLTPVLDAAALLSQMFYYFDVDSAIGPQLDAIGEIIGAPRLVPFNPTSFNGVLDDTHYRVFIKAKIAQNQWNGLISSLYPIWQVLFPGGTIVIQDNQNMTATITLAGTFDNIYTELISNGLIVPRPEGVQYTFVFALLPIFGFDQNNTYVAGFDLGHFA